MSSVGLSFDLLIYFIGLLMCVSYIDFSIFF